MYFNIKCIGSLPGPTNEFERSLVFETGEFERPKFDCIEENNEIQIRLLQIFKTQNLSVCQVDHSLAIFFTMLLLKDKTV